MIDCGAFRLERLQANTPPAFSVLRAAPHYRCVMQLSGKHLKCLPNKCEHDPNPAECPGVFFLVFLHR